MLTSLSAADLRALRLFQTIYESGSFAGAERRLDIGQSTISTQILGLERRLGFRVCDRGPGGFRLTARGRSLLEAYAHLATAMDDFTQAVDDLSRQVLGTLRLGLMDHTSSDPRFSTVELLRLFHQRVPDVNLEIVQDIQANLTDLVMSKSLDLAIGAFPVDDPRFDITPLYNEEQFIYCGPPHPLFEAVPVEIDPQRLKAEKWVRRSYNLVPVGGFPIAFGPDMAVAANLEAVALILRALPVLGYLPTHVAASVAGQGEVRRVSDAYSISYQISLLSRRGQRDTAAMKRFRSVISEYVRKSR